MQIVNIEIIHKYTTMPFIREWRVEFGFHGEQGAESLHARIKRISSSYGSMPSRVERLKSVIREHHLQVSPTLIAQEPVTKRKKIYIPVKEDLTIYVYVITPFGVVLLVYSPDSPRARSARGGRADKPQHHDKRCDKMFITVDWSLPGNSRPRENGASL